MKKIVLSVLLSALFSMGVSAQNFSDTTRNYSLPQMYQLGGERIGLSWLELDADGVNHFCWAVSSDYGASFSQKADIYASETLRGSRLMKPNVLIKKNGGLVAIFGMSPKNHTNHPKEAAPKKGRRPSSLFIMFAESSDNGKTWSEPQPVHKDNTPNIIRGFFDSAVMPNDEVAVAFLKDTGKPHERDLRIITSKNGVFEDERLLDKMVCDCCNVSFLVDNSGNVNLYYRANNSNIRDMAFMTSSDNGKTFSNQKIIFPDNWKIEGCPHSGPISTFSGDNNYIAWLSGEQTTEPGIRLANQNGERLFVLEGSASNPALVSSDEASYLIWEATDEDLESLNYRNIENNEVSGSLNQSAYNPSGLVVGGKLLLAFESPISETKNTIKFEQIKL